MITHLALDLAGVTGYAWKDSDGLISYGVRDFTAQVEGARSFMPAYELKRWLLTPQFSRLQSVIYEDTFARGAAKFRLDSLQTIVAVHCLQRGIDWCRISPSAIKKYATGSGKSGKDQMVTAAKEFLSIDVELGYDEADALCLLKYLLELTSQKG